MTDDDTAGLTITPETRLTVYEDGTPDYFEVKLNSAPPTDMPLTVTVSATPADAVTITVKGDVTDKVVFTADDWDRYQQVRVVGENDDTDNPGDNRSVTIKVDPDDQHGYDESDTVIIQATVIDNDTAELVFDPEPTILVEDDDLRTSLWEYHDLPSKAAYYDLRAR